MFRQNMIVALVGHDGFGLLWPTRAMFITHYLLLLSSSSIDVINQRHYSLFHCYYYLHLEYKIALKGTRACIDPPVEAMPIGHPRSHPDPFPTSSPAVSSYIKWKVCAQRSCGAQLMPKPTENCAPQKTLGRHSKIVTITRLSGKFWH